MNEFYSNTGGRFTYKEDIENLQGLALSYSSIFEDSDNFIISGCGTSGSVGNTTMEEGYVWINGKVRYFPGQTSINYAITTYISESNTSENRKFSDDSIKKGVEVYASIWSETLPVGVEYIEISNVLTPTLKEKFFGKYSILLDTSKSSQVLEQLLELKDGLNLLNSDSLKSEIAYDTKITWKDSAGDIMMEAGYIGGLINDFVLNANDVADIEVRPKDFFKSTKPIKEEGVLLSAKYLGVGDAYTSSEVDTLLTFKANVADVYTQSELDTAFLLKADKSNVLELNNTDSYTPTQDYHPVTKKFLEDSIGIVPISTTNHTVTGGIVSEAVYNGVCYVSGYALTNATTGTLVTLNSHPPVDWRMGASYGDSAGALDENAACKVSTSGVLTFESWRSDREFWFSTSFPINN